MEHEGKTRSPYKGVLGSSLLLIGVPLLLFIFVFLVVRKFTNQPLNMDINFSLMIGVGCGFLLQLSCILSGLMKGTFKVVTNRVKNFFSNLTINFKFAVKYYWDDIKTEGVVFWIYFLILGTTFAFAFIGIFNSYMLYINYK